MLTSNDLSYSQIIDTVVIRALRLSINELCFSRFSFYFVLDGVFHVALAQLFNIIHSIKYVVLKITLRCFVIPVLYMVFVCSQGLD